MDVLSFSDTRARLREVMDRVAKDRAPVTITRRKAEPVVMVSLSEWSAMQETLHLLASPANAARLQASIADLQSGDGVSHALAERS